MRKAQENLIDLSNNWVDKSKPTVSISQILGYLQEPFDSEAVAKKTAEKNSNNPDSIYFGKSVAQIVEMWDAKAAASRNYGQMLDEYIGLTLNEDADGLEMFKLDHDIDGDERLRNITGSFDSFVQFITESTGLEFVTREKTLYWEGPGYYARGRFDCMMFDPKTETFIIIDWKSTDKIDITPSRWTTKLLGPGRTIDALNGNTYTLQTQFYKKCLLDHYLPNGTDPSKVAVRVVNLPGHPFDDGLTYRVFKENIPFDSDLMARIIDFGFKKHKLITKK